MIDQYLQEGWYYNNQYDRTTIKELKVLTENVIAEKEKLDSGQTTDEQPLTDAFNYFEYVRRQRFDRKSEAIAEWMDADRQRDHLVARNPAPLNIKCQVCGSKMTFETHVLKNDDKDILFVFSCPKKHLPKQMHYPNGTLYLRKIYKPTCVLCGGDILSATSKIGTITTFTDTCLQCHHVEAWEINDTEDEEPIDEADRKRYCTDLEDVSPLMKGIAYLKELSPILDIIQEMQESAKKNELYEPELVERLNIPQLEQKLLDGISKAGFIKMQFEKPELGKHVLLSFSVQDPTDRVMKNSLKALRTVIEETLFTTNWRLEFKTVKYRMGFLSGQLIGYEKEEDIREIAKEIYHKSPKTDSD